MMTGGAFHPAWWCPGRHAQTILGSLGTPGKRLPITRQFWDLPDGDVLDVDLLACRAGEPLLIILHGLESSSRTSSVISFLREADRRGWGAIAMNFRSCGGTINRLRRSYHGGDTGDLAWVLARAIAEHPGSPVFCAGFSLGGNVLLKYLGEQGDRLAAEVRAAAAISAPFDLSASVRQIEQGFSRVYGNRLAQSLTAKTWAKMSTYPDLVDPGALRAVRTVAEFDELVTAPLHGFASAAAYWAASSSGQFLARIARSTLLVNAVDDPFFPGALLPRETVARNPCLSAEFPATGGHMGFVTGPWPGWGMNWAVRRAADFLARHLGR